MTNLVDFLENNKVKIVESFPAFQELENSNDDNAIVLSSATPSKLIKKNINEYYSLILPRGFKAETADDLLELNPQIQLNYIEEVEVKEEEITKETAVIVSRHESTNKILQSKYPDLDILTGNVAKNDITNKIVIGVLPPFLIQYAKAFIATSISNYDASKKDDIKIIEEDLIISNPIVLDVITENPCYEEINIDICPYANIQKPMREIKINLNTKTKKAKKQNIKQLVEMYKDFVFFRELCLHLKNATDYIYDGLYNKDNKDNNFKNLNNIYELLIFLEHQLKIYCTCITQTYKINENTLSFTILKY